MNLRDRIQEARVRGCRIILWDPRGSTLPATRAMARGEPRLATENNHFSIRTIRGDLSQWAGRRGSAELCEELAVLQLRLREAWPVLAIGLDFQARRQGQETSRWNLRRPSDLRACDTRAPQRRKPCLAQDGSKAAERRRVSASSSSSFPARTHRWHPSEAAALAAKRLTVATPEL